MKYKKIAIIYDWADSWGGVERLLLTLHDLFPNAPLYTSYYTETTAWAKKFNIKTSFIHRLPEFIKKNRILSLPFYPYSFESLNFSDYDLVISVSSSFAKGIITQPKTTHINICLTPTRYLWLYPELYLTPGVKNIAATIYEKHIKKWDLVAAQRPDHIISISETVKKRVKEIYKRDSTIIYPPFNLQYWEKIKLKLKKTKPQINFPFDNKTYKNRMLNKKFYMTVSRLAPYKRIDLVIESFKYRPAEGLVIVGYGPEKNRLKKISGNNVLYYENITDEMLARFYINSEALIMPQEEDFGYTCLEAQFFGCPVIALKKGGATETVIENNTGIFFEEQTVNGLTRVLKKYDTIKSILKKKAKIQGPDNVKNYSKNKFIKNLLNYIDQI